MLLLGLLPHVRHDAPPAWSERPRALQNVLMRAPPPLSAIPKAETGVQALLESTPEADGRGIRVAVLDTGCDLAAAGLQTTSDGKPKYLDFLDCTGGGDIDTSLGASPRDDGTLLGLSGRSLKLGAWAEGVREFRLGALRLYALGSMPSSALRRVKSERKASFAAQHHHATGEVQRQLDSLPPEERAAKEDLELQLAQLDEMMKEYSDDGPLLDVVLFQDEARVWRAVVDKSGEGDLSDATPMAPYKHEQQARGAHGGGACASCHVRGTLGAQVYEGGDILSVVTDAGSHGTHVAGIVAANFEEAPELNGVAPGAQILACKIGDGRLQGGETGTGLVRALIAAKAYQCDLINLSYGEPAWQHDKGRVSATLTAAVRQWGMALFTSAGNDGPALSSLGSPGALSAPITVGAYVSPAMMAEQYSMLPVAAVAGAAYSFSSRGPTHDGFLPSLCAPGGAIAPVPRHSLQGRAQYHGTSMSSPNACGAAACVLSALRRRGVRPPPPALRRALENSARTVALRDEWAEGAGLLDAAAAAAYAAAHDGKPAQHVEFELRVPSRGGARGVYLRDRAEVRAPLAVAVSVAPLFEQAAPRSEEEVRALLALQLHLRLEPSAEWITAPASLFLGSAKERGSQSFTVRVDPTRLAPGAHFARVQAFDIADPSRGALFSLPVTVIIPHSAPPPPADDADAHPPIEFPIQLRGGLPVRRFVSAPAAAEWATLKLRTAALPDGPHVVTVHVVPCARGDLPTRYTQTKKSVALREHSVEELAVPVRGGATLELCLQLAWLANPAPAALDASLEFHSLGVRGAPMVPRAVRLGHSETYARLEVEAPLRTERLAPKAKVTVVERAIRPSHHVLAAGSAERDVLPPSDAVAQANPLARGLQIHSMVLTYRFDVAPEGDATEQVVVPRLAPLHDQLYDSPLDSMLWRLEDSNGQPLKYGGAMHDASDTPLKKGEYTLSVLLRHPERGQLAALKDLPLLLRMPLAAPVDCPIYSGRGDATTGGYGGAAAVKEAWLRRGGRAELYVCRPSAKLPSWLRAGDVLDGLVTLDEAQPHATRLPLAVEMPPPPPPPPPPPEAQRSANASATEGTAAADEKALAEAIFEAKLRRLAALRQEGAAADRFDSLAAAMTASDEPSVDLLLEVLAFKRACTPPADVADGGVAEWRAAEVSLAADKLTAPGGPIDPALVAQYFGVAHDADAMSEEAKETEKSMKQKRKAVRIGLLCKAEALAACLDDFNSTSAQTIAEREDGGGKLAKFNDAVVELKRWVSGEGDLEEESDKDCLALTLLRYEIGRARPGAALAVARKRLKSQQAGGAGAKALTVECIKLYRSLGLDFWAANAEETLFARFPVVKLPL
ncbi:hypothetical protein AB1Y20_007665 [Prymnesium parvum]|uniref:tripeptidyl-peptidase II n=1 Tax=Prymnesium parvum TaxID=97485 RepID=A0AB34IY64_PRYPA